MSYNTEIKFEEACYKSHIMANWNAKLSLSLPIKEIQKSL